MKPLKNHILIVEDEADIVTLVRYNLEAAGFVVSAASDGEEGLLCCRENPPDLALIDWMLPLISGVELCARLRRDPATRGIAIIMVTARGEEGDRVRGLNAGADDYITKPFSPAEMIARIRAVLRRSHPGSGGAEGESLRFADLEMDLARHRVRRRDQEVRLGPTEFRLLRHFLANPGRVFSREQLLDRVWGTESFVEPRTVDVHIRRLRKALNRDAEGDLIRTVRSAGYALDNPDPPRE